MPALPETGADAKDGGTGTEQSSRREDDDEEYWPVKVAHQDKPPLYHAHTDQLSSGIDDPRDMSTNASPAGSDGDGVAADTGPTPLPKKQVALVGAVLFADTFSSLVIFPWLPFMVHDFFPHLDKNEIGFYAGYVGSIYYLGNFLSNYVWGVLSDRFGRRPILLLGMAASAVCVFLFGMSVNFTMALSMRFLWGILNGNAGVTKTVLSELCDETNSAKGFAILGILGGLGRTVGPAAGGFLARPATKRIPFFGDIGLFKEFPYLLPCLVSVLLGLVNLLAVYCLLVETHPLKAHKDSAYHNASCATPSSASSSCRRFSSGDDRSHTGQYSRVEVDDEEEEEDVADAENTEDAHGSIELQPLHRAVEKAQSRPHRVRAKYLQLSVNSEEKDSGTTDVGANGYLDSAQDDDDEDEDQRRCGSTRRLLEDREVLITTSLYGLLGFSSLCANEIFPLWVLLPRNEHGFEWEESNIGTLLACVGPTQLLYQILVYPRLTHRFGIKLCCEVGALVFAAVAIAFPFTELTDTDGTPAWVLFGVLWLAQVVAINGRVTSFTCVFVMISNSCLPVHRGAVNGIGQSMAALGRTLAPTVGSVLFAWSVNNGLGWPFNFHFVWYLIALDALVVFILCRRLGPEIQIKKESRVLLQAEAEHAPS